VTARTAHELNDTVALGIALSAREAVGKTQALCGPGVFPA